MKSMRRRLLSSIYAVALIAIWAGGAMSQTQGEITGVITDSRGAAIGGATVIVTNTATGEARTVVSNVVGIYRFPALSPAIYTLRIDKSGFMRAERSGVQVQVGQAVRLDLTLEVGEIFESIEITAVDQGDGTSREGAKSSSLKGAPIGGGNAFQFFSQEMTFDNTLVIGAPFSADVDSETIQTLADGTHIIQSFTGRMYRDSQGRTRNERAFRMGGTSESIETITIYDPVGGASYILTPISRIAHKTEVPVRATSPQPPANAEAPKNVIKVSGGVLPGLAIKKVVPPYPSIAIAARTSGPVLVQIHISETGEVQSESVLAGHPLLRNAALQAARQWKFRPTMLSGIPIKIRGLLRFNFTLINEELSPAQDARSTTKYKVSSEQLTNQLVEGIECEGTRTVTTIPVGAIGNDRPIETTGETCYSPELRIMILSKRSDPRFGDSIYRVTNITRAEPEDALFRVPPDYKINETKK
jgi:TonB family protein